MLSVKNIQFSYSETTKFSYPDVYCTMNNPLLITGKSGTGKTTFLHIMAGLLKPDKGGVFINDVNLSQLPAGKLDKFRGKNIGIVFQRSHFMAALTVLDNIVLSQYFSGNKITRDKVKKIAERLGVNHLLNKFPSRLSQGEQQRVSIARALMNDPKVLLADEPTSSLDDENCQQVIQLLKEQSAFAGAALIIITHDGRIKESFTNSIQLS